MDASAPLADTPPPTLPGSEDDALTIQDLLLQPSQRRVYQSGTLVSLSALEFDILHALMRRPGEALSRDELERQIYPWRPEVASNAVEVHVHYLRRKLGRSAIRTVRGAGYLMPLQLPAAGR